MNERKITALGKALQEQTYFCTALCLVTEKGGLKIHMAQAIECAHIKLHDCANHDHSPALGLLYMLKELLSSTLFN